MSETKGDLLRGLGVEIKRGWWWYCPVCRYPSKSFGSYENAKNDAVRHAKRDHGMVKEA